ncbi:MAG: tetratricopeptide repeat protein [Candidatus Riflebacteria bacterium]|nr:tetratricopeptide repeat protein [Candidatus Riflebacteria bacterium]
MCNNPAGLIKSAIRAVAALVLLLVGFAVTSSALNAQDLFLANEIYNQGLEHYADGDYPGAIDYLEQIVLMMPDHDQARYYLAYSYSLSGKHEKAIDQARVLAARYPGHQLYTQLIAEFSQRKLNHQETKIETPSDADSQLTSASGYDVYTPQLSKPREFRKKTVESPAQTRLEHISDMIDEERYAEASDELQGILAADPKNAEVMHYMGVVFFNQGDFAKAVERFEESLKNHSGNFDTHFFAGSCYLNQQILEKAEHHFEQALMIKKDTFARINLADIFMRTNRLADAEKMYESVMRSNPDFSEAKVGMAQVKLAQGFIEEAAELVNQILSDNPVNARARYARSQILMENRLYSEALEEAQAACQNSVDNAEYRVSYALTMLRNFQVEPGMREAQDILDRWPGFVEAQLVLVEGLIMAGDTTAATEQLNAAAASRYNPQIDYFRATLAATSGDTELARTYWSKYLEKAASLPSAHLKYAAFLESTAANAEALKVYESIVANFPDTTVADNVQADIARLSQAAAEPSVAPRPPVTGL